MNEPKSISWVGHASLLLSVLCLVLAFALVLFGAVNRSLKAQLADGQAQVVKAQTLANVDNSLVQLVAKSAVENNDLALRDLLSRNGVTFKTNGPKTQSVSAPNEAGQHDQP